MKHFLKYFPGVLLIAFSCRSDDPKAVDIGLDYFPLKSKYYQLFNINQTNYVENAAPEVLSYQLMVEVVDSFPNPEGNYTFILNRSKRANANSPWESFDTWSVRANDREVVVNEGNIAYVKLMFPVKKGNTWDGNKLNTQEKDTYTVETFDESFTAGGITFDKTLKVNQEDNGDLIVFLDRRSEVYARNAGLVYREITQLHYCTSDDCRGQQQIKNGKIFKQEIVEYGMR